MRQPPQPTHVFGMHKGEQLSVRVGKEPGRGERKTYRTARDSTSIDPKQREPIHPAMPSIPPA